MGRTHISILAVLMLVVAAGCGQGTTDPRDGGLFSYNPEAYEKRLEERRAEKKRLEEENQKLKKEQQDLKDQTGAAQAERDRLASQVAALDQDVNQVEQMLTQVKAQTDEQKHQLWKAQVKLKDTKRRMQEFKTSNNASKDQEEYLRLRKRLDQLMEEAEALSNI